MHASSLVDIMADQRALLDDAADQRALLDDAADQRALDDAKALVQGGSSIENYIKKATTICNGRLAHKNLKHYPEFFFIEMFRSGLSTEIKARIPAITDSTDFTAYTKMALNNTTMALNIGIPLESAAAATLPPPTKKETPGESTIKKETPGEWTINIIKLFQADPSDIFETANKVLDIGLVNLSTVKLGKKNVGVLRDMVGKVGTKYSDRAQEKFKQLPNHERTDKTEIGILVRELVLYKNRLADNAKYNAKKMASAA